MIPSEPGTYVLCFALQRPVTVTVGRLGGFEFEPGWYAYVGSARGPGGLAARIRRHLRLSKSEHWHIDYVRSYMRPVEVWYARGKREERECRWADVLRGLPGAAVPVPRFGASDCRCATHLIFFPALPRAATFSSVVGDRVSRQVLADA